MQKDENRELRQKLRRLEVLLAADVEARTGEWFEGEVPANDFH